MEITVENIPVIQEMLMLEEYDLSLEDAFNVYNIFNDIIDKWDSGIRNAFNLNDELDMPTTDCECGYFSMIPIDYYISDDKKLVLCGKCKSCGGYKEMKIITVEYPIQFKQIDYSVSGISASIKTVKKPKTMFI